MALRGRVVMAIAAVGTLGLLLGPTPPLQGQEERAKATLMNPAALKEQAPATFKVNFETNIGTFVVDAHRDWAPFGADRFYNLAKSGFYDENRFFWVTPIMAVFGLNGDPAIAKVWIGAKIPDDPTRVRSNTKGTVALSHANQRRTMTFINLVDNPTLDRQVTPFGEVISGMNLVERLYNGYGDGAPTGKGPIMTPFYREGNVYLAREFPKLDYIKKATIVP